MVVIGSGSLPVTALKARQASMKVMAWPLSSQAPRATMILRPSGQRLDARLERRRLPLVQRIDRLHVIMAVKQHARTGNAVRFADHHRMALGRAHVGGKADAAQVGGDVLGGGAALLLVGRVGGNRGDAQQREQPLDALVDILVDAAQDRVECAHDGLLQAGNAS